MQFVPSLPPPITPAGPEEGLEVNKLSEVKPVKGVLEQPASTPTLKLHAQHEPPANPNTLAEISEKRHAGAAQGERRIVCRRVMNQPILAELRAELDRRRRTQRKNDMPEHIDEEA
jgi:hypothetical protein